MQYIVDLLRAGDKSYDRGVALLLSLTRIVLSVNLGCYLIADWTKSFQGIVHSEIYKVFESSVARLHGHKLIDPLFDYKADFFNASLAFQVIVGHFDKLFGKLCNVSKAVFYILVELILIVCHDHCGSFF